MIVRCGNCKDEITSKHVHEWVCCSCWTNTADNTGIYIDGGKEYTRLGGDLFHLTWYNTETMEFQPLEGFEK